MTMNAFLEINNLVKQAQAAVKTDNTTSPEGYTQKAKPIRGVAKPQISEQRLQYRRQLGDILSFQKDPNGYWRQQQNAKGWTKSQIDDIRQNNRYLEAIRNNPNATPEQLKEGLRRARYLRDTYGRSPVQQMQQNNPNAWARYGGNTDKRTGATIVNGDGPESKMSDEESRFWKRELGGTELTYGSDGQLAVSEDKAVELAPGLSIKPRKVMSSPGHGEGQAATVRDRADQALIDRYKQYRLQGSTAADRVPMLVYKNGQPYIRQYGKLTPYDQYIDPRGYARRKRKVFI